MPTLADADESLLRVLLGVIAADETEGEDGPARARAVYSRLTGREVSADEVAARLASARQDTDWLACARSIAARLDEADKQRVMTGAFEIAVADGFVLDAEDRVLATLGAALGFSEADFRALAERVIAASTPD